MKSKKITEKDKWNNPLLFNNYERYRFQFRKANKKVVAEVLKKYTLAEMKILEIGSGLGELVYNLLSAKSPFRKAILQTEQGQRNILAHKKKYPKSNIVKANVYNLPFKDNSFDIVLGYSSFDTLQFLTKALKEVKRVLKKEGRFIHLLDLSACPETVLLDRKVIKKSEIPFPNLYHGHIVGYQIVSKKEFEAKKKLIDIMLLPLYEKYIQNVEAMYTDIQKKYSYPLSGLFAVDVRRRFKIIREVDVNDYFFKGIKKALKKNKFNIEKFGIWEAMTLERKDKRFSYLPKKVNLLENEIGYQNGMYLSKLNRSLKKRQIAIVSKLHCIVAKK